MEHTWLGGDDVTSWTQLEDELAATHLRSMRSFRPSEGGVHAPQMCQSSETLLIEWKNSMYNSCTVPCFFLELHYYMQGLVLLFLNANPCLIRTSVVKI